LFLNKAFKQYKAVIKHIEKVANKKIKALEKEKKKIENQITTISKRASQHIVVTKEKMQAYCPHLESTHVDTWHPHTRDGDEYYICKECGKRRDV
jgi:transposase-like protein